MTTPYPLVRFPDAELVARSYLQEVLGETVTVLTDLPPEDVFQECLPTGIVRCVRIGGTSRIRWNLDEPTIDIDVYSPSLSSTNQLVADIRAAIESMPTFANESMAVTGSFEVSGPNRRPEENPNVHRVGFTIGLRLRPLN